MTDREKLWEFEDGEYDGASLSIDDQGRYDLTVYNHTGCSVYLDEKELDKLGRACLLGRVEKLEAALKDCEEALSLAKKALPEDADLFELLKAKEAIEQYFMDHRKLVKEVSE